MKSAVIEELRSKHGMSAAAAAEAFDSVFGAVKAVLESSDRVQVPGFGIFRRKLRDTRTVRNPRTGEKSTLSAHHVVTFKEAKRARK